ncbi:uncharacterized protein LOC131026106 [Salvia miltiorrhiza]|uniref:uncharacterized protein LOC131026106 n=1 Tax=Salvia miltiorrhiza TaxID=226208 RepID=UPI0025AD1237|nr:uncharacterized protein LOC131026106 [Salvia miltiorrhiza]
MGEWVEGIWEWKLEWVRELRERDLFHVNELLSLIDNVSLTPGKIDGWKWKASPNSSFSVNSAYKVMCRDSRSKTQSNKGLEFQYIWKAAAPHKAKFSAWRILKDRMATCENLIRRQVSIPNAESICVFCRSQQEDTNHLFFICQRTSEAWYDILSWLGLQAVLPSSAKDHFLAFTSLGNKRDTKLLRNVWICMVWCI